MLHSRSHVQLRRLCGILIISSSLANPDAALFGSGQNMLGSIRPHSTDRRRFLKYLTLLSGNDYIVVHLRSSLYVFGSTRRDRPIH